MTCTSPLPINRIAESFCKSLSIFFTDLDGTITNGGFLTPSSYQSLWDLYEQGIEVVVVTGRPAGWCDHIARMWPVKGVIGENGAFYYSYKRNLKKMERFYLISESERLKGRRRLERVRERVLREVPSCRIAADQSFRKADLAIDCCEDVAPLKDDEIRSICRIIESEGAAYKISSIHVNCWYGAFDKVSGVKEFLVRTHNQSLSKLQDSIVFIGDSPNDEPMFKELNNTVAVANIAPYLPKLKYFPLYITDNKAARGFSEAVRTILDKRKNRS